MITTSQAYERGFASGRRARGAIAQRIASTFESWRVGNPASAHLDYAQELIALDKERLDAKPSLAKFPETQGWADLVLAERRGFQDASGAGKLELAFHFNAHYFMWYRLNTRYVGSPVGTSQCTAVFIRDSSEGGPLYGRNWDMPNVPGLDLRVPRYGPDGVPRLWCKGVSCATLCDEEPTEVFPINAWRVLPDDCRKLPDVVEFLTRYVEFWFPHNGVIVDEDLNCVAFEKSNCRIGWRYTDNGTAAVTACAQLIPEMREHRERCHRTSLAKRGMDESSPDWLYWSGAEKRYRRLLALVAEAAKIPGGPSLNDLASIMTDHAVPYPDCVCIAGQSPHPDLDPSGAEWTMRSRSVVLSGPNRRTLFWRVEGNQPCYANPPFLILGEGVTMRREWQAGTRTPPPADGPDDEFEPYRQFEFDYPERYPL